MKPPHKSFMWLCPLYYPFLVLLQGMHPARYHTNRIEDKYCRCVCCSPLHRFSATISLKLMPAIITESTFALPSVVAAVLSRPWSLRKCDTLWDHPLSSFLNFSLLPHSHLIWVWLGLLRFGLVCWFLLLSAAGALFARLLDALRAGISSAQKVLPHGVNICDIIKRRSAWYDSARDRQGGKLKREKEKPKEK